MPIIRLYSAQRSYSGSLCGSASAKDKGVGAMATSDCLIGEGTLNASAGACETLRFSATSRRNSSIPFARRTNFNRAMSLFLRFPVSVKTRRMASMVGSSSSSGRKSVSTAASVGKLPSPPPTRTLKPRRGVPLLPRTCAMRPTSWIPATAQSPSFSQPEKAILNLRGKS